MDDDVRLDSGKDRADGRGLCEVSGMVRSTGVRVAGCAQVEDGHARAAWGCVLQEVRDNVRAEETATTCDEDGAKGRDVRFR